MDRRAAVRAAVRAPVRALRGAAVAVVLALLMATATEPASAGTGGGSGATGADSAATRPALAGVPLPDPDRDRTARPFPAPLPMPGPTLAPGTSVAGPDLTTHSTTDPQSPWVVVNKALPLSPADHAPTDLVPVGGVPVRADVAGPLTAMIAAAAAEGLTVPVLSGYRSYADQSAVYAGWVAGLGQTRADEVSARPGHSEHQTGLAVDVGRTTAPGCDFEDCFAGTAEGEWLTRHAGEFGFLVRYTEAVRAVTGYAPEGWHLRWVGTDLVAAMDRLGVATLEETFGLPGGWEHR